MHVYVHRYLSVVIGSWMANGCGGYAVVRLGLCDNEQSRRCALATAGECDGGHLFGWAKVMVGNCHRVHKRKCAFFCGRPRPNVDQAGHASPEVVQAGQMQRWANATVV